MAGQSHIPAAINRGLGEGGGPEVSDLRLNGRKIIMRGVGFSTQTSLPYKGSAFKL